MKITMTECIYHRPIDGQPDCVTLWKACTNTPQSPCEHFAPMVLKKKEKK